LNTRLATGTGDASGSEDLTQVTFTKLYRCWHRIARHDTVDRYAQRVLLRTFLDAQRGGQVVTAVRLLDGGFLAVMAQQGTAAYQPSAADLPPDAVRVPAPGAGYRPPLAVQPFPPQRVAALAADPAMLG